MPDERGIVELSWLTLSHGEGRSLELDVDLRPITLAAERYQPIGGATLARLDVSRTSAGYALRLRLATEIAGPCVRCLGPAVTLVEVDAREVDQPSSDDENLRSPYVEEERLDLSHWANDTVVLAMPERPLCRDGCLGLCPVCGEALEGADPEAHRHRSGGDPHFAKLRDLKLD